MTLPCTVYIHIHNDFTMYSIYTHTYILYMRPTVHPSANFHHPPLPPIPSSGQTFHNGSISPSKRRHHMLGFLGASHMVDSSDQSDDDDLSDAVDGVRPPLYTVNSSPYVHHWFDFLLHVYISQVMTCESMLEFTELTSGS